MELTLSKGEDGNWSAPPLKTINLPPHVEPDQTHSLELASGAAVAFVGANGAGKSRMAAWIDRANSETLYIRARRNVVMPDSYVITPESAEFIGIYAGGKINTEDIKTAKSVRYSSSRDGFGDDDFALVINLLGSRHATSALKFRRDFDPKNPPPNAPASELDVAISIWTEVLSHLEIDASTAPELRVRRRLAGAAFYPPKEMSDGEKAIFYLVGKCLIAPAGSIIVIDEPEMYVHRSIRNKLWDRIESRRTDCNFIYLTHDLDFVRARSFATKYVVRAYDRSDTEERWDYVPFSPDADADEALQISVWGSRQPTLLVEGSSSSLDLKILAHAYPSYAIVPSGSCDQVIYSVSALRSAKAFHHQQVHGLVDRDFRSDDEVSALKRKGVHCLSFREIENIVVSEAALRAVMSHLGTPHAEIQAVMSRIVSILRPKFVALAKTRASQIFIRNLLNLAQDRGAAAEKIDSVSDILNESDFCDADLRVRSAVNRIVSDGNWDELLSIFSVRKDDFGGVIAKQLGFRDFAAFTDMVIRISSVEESGKRLRRAINSKLPSI